MTSGGAIKEEVEVATLCFFLRSSRAIAETPHGGNRSVRVVGVAPLQNEIAPKNVEFQNEN